MRPRYNGCSHQRSNAGRPRGDVPTQWRRYRASGGTHQEGLAPAPALAPGNHGGLPLRNGDRGVIMCQAAPTRRGRSLCQPWALGNHGGVAPTQWRLRRYRVSGGTHQEGQAPAPALAPGNHVGLPLRSQFIRRTREMLMRPSHPRDVHRRRSTRLRGYDYAQPGAYFVTICTQNRECLFGEIVDGAMHLNQMAEMVATVWNDLPQHYSGVDVDAFVIMPNHVHGIVMLSAGQPRGVAPTLSLPDVVHRFKSLTTARYRRGAAREGWPAFAGRLWQRNYYEHVIRDEGEMNRVREYIVNNPADWAQDENNPAPAAQSGDRPQCGTHT